MARTFCLAILLVLCASAPAYAQDPLVDDVQELTQEPPVELGEPDSDPDPDPDPDADPDPDPDPDADPDPDPDPEPDELPDTGSEPLALLLLGAGLIGAGAGVRLRVDGA